MVAVFEVVERLAGAGLHPARAIQQMRHLIDAGIVRRGPRGRPSSSGRVECTTLELADTVSSMAAQLPIQAPQKARRVGGYIVARSSPVVDELFALPDPDATLRTWLITVLARLAALPREQRTTLYLADPPPTLIFRDELTSPHPYVEDAKFKWGEQFIDFRPHETPLRDIIGGRRPKIRPSYEVVIEIGLLLDLTPPPARPEPEDTAALPGAAASPIPADAEQPLATARRQPGPSNPKVGVGVSEGNRSVELAGQILAQEPPHAPRHRRRP